jgi:hypothetical protein
MTVLDQFDPFAGRISAALEEIAPASRPAYLDTVLAQTADTRQRPRWTFPGRWFPMDTAIARSSGLSRVPVRPLVILILVLLLAIAAAIVWVGSQRHVPPPFGPAANGSIAYGHAGDIWIRDALDGGERPLIAGPDDERYPSYSPDGTRLVYSDFRNTAEYLWTADADGSNRRQLLPDPLLSANGGWGPDSRTLAIVNEVHGQSRLFMIDAVTGAVREPLAGLEDLTPVDVTLRPPDGRQLLVRMNLHTNRMDLYTLNVDGTDLHPLGLASPMLFGPQWELTGSTFSPDGSRIAYNAVETDPATGYDHFRVHVVNADGTHDVELPGPSDPKVHEAWPQFSPDGRTILVHDWTWKTEGNQGWVSVMPADGSAPSHRIGPAIPGGEDTGISKLWSPDGTRVLMRTENTTTAYSIDPVTDTWSVLDWTHDLPDWQRIARH